ncbi:MAG: hypothetical protein A2297_08825 [Elusimicrobia bacterium RIFOXYB2_FULL_48_7]|nr:MAG: hypothetical protein A2297_08825 [Elusimicrobia bacterium RIFOXYB2_FULL_48_7]
MSQLIDELTKPLETLVASLGSFELVDLEYHKEGNEMVLRVFADLIGRMPGDKGISIEECSLISRKISDYLDKEGLISGNYNLEVSSPGLFRKIKKPADFLKFTGSKARIRFFEPMEGQKNLLGLIQGIENGILGFETLEKKEYKIDLSKIASANLEPDL